MPEGQRPNILVIWGDDIGISNLSCYGDGVKAASFTIDQAVAKLEAALTTGH
jgi:arylsulfatase A-like enzyme